MCTKIKMCDILLEGKGENNFCMVEVGKLNIEKENSI
jgi:hypothetical protein